MLSDISGFKLGTFPTRYLGLPLKPGKRLSLASLQLLIDKITSKLHSWTVKYLSFAGKITLISSVIYGMVNFLSVVFVLPKAFYAKIDSICVGFLWKNDTTPARGSRVAWSDICKPKSERGLGIRLLEDFEAVFKLKTIWNFFTVSESLWVAWLKNHHFRRLGFWLTKDSTHFSATIRSMLELRPILKYFMHCVVGNGETVTFWFDSLTSIGPLIDVAGQGGPRAMRLNKGAKVRDATRQGSWFLPPVRSDALHAVQVEITNFRPPLPLDERDVFQWCRAYGSFGSSFSSKAKWESLRDPSPTVFWHKVIWFKEPIPQNSFMAWLALLRRLPTRDRLRRWGMNVPAACVLCSNGLESHHHLFFECEYSHSIWNSFASQIWEQPPLDLHSVAAWIVPQRSPSNANANALIKLIFQSSIYLLWKERNARIFTNISSPSHTIHLALDRLICDRLLSLPLKASTRSFRLGILLLHLPATLKSSPLSFSLVSLLFSLMFLSWVVFSFLISCHNI